MRSTDISEKNAISKDTSLATKIKRALPESIFNTLRKWKKNFNLKKISKYDNQRFSAILTRESREKLEYNLFMTTHIIEKGLSHNDIRLGFGKNGLTSLGRNLYIWNKKGYNKDSLYYQNALSVIKEYIALHERADFKVDFLKNYFEESIIEEALQSKEEHAGYYEMSSSKVYNHSTFSDLANNRYSIREFDDELVQKSDIIEAISVAQRSPTACNRQPARVYAITDRNQIKKVLDLQGGFRGYELPGTVLVTVTDTIAYSNPTDRNLPYIDGALFTMSLVYALQERKIGSCLLNTCFNIQKDKKMREIINIKNSEVFINVIPIGYLQDQVRVCKSKRLPNEEVIKFISPTK